MNKILFVTTYYPFQQATGFQKASRAFLEKLPSDRTAIFCLHPKSLPIDCYEPPVVDAKIVINPLKSSSRLIEILMAVCGLIRLLPYQVIAHQNNEFRTKIKHYCELNEVSEVYIEAIWLIDLIPELTNVPIHLHAHILDSENLLSSRNWFTSICFRPFYLLMKRFEEQKLQKFENIFTNSPRVKKLIENNYKLKVRLTKNYYNSENIGAYRASFSKKILLVGDFSYRPNMDALMNLISILEQRPELQSKYQFCVIGRLKNIDSFRRKFPMIEFTGFVDDLYAAMSECCVSICPIDYASGAKIKIIESLRLGLPVITSKACIEASGCVDGYGTLSYHSTKEFVERLQSIIDDHSFWAEQSNIAIEYAKRNFE